jgi:hypothetical protein
MARRSDQFHGFLHTCAGAAVVALFSVVVGRPICQRLLRWWVSEPHVPLKEYFNFSPEIRIGPAVAGAFAGTARHVLLDSFMHAEVHPLAPFNDGNQMFGVVGPGVLHLICFVLVVVGVLVCARLPKAKL